MYIKAHKIVWLGSLGQIPRSKVDSALVSKTYVLFWRLFESHYSYADPGIFVRGGGPGQSDITSSDNVFFCPQLILQKSNGQFQRNLTFFKVPEGVQHFPGGSNCLFPIETHITCDFPGGSGPPVPPSGSALDHSHHS